MYYSVTNYWHYLSRISFSLVFIKMMRVAILRATKPPHGTDGGDISFVKYFTKSLMTSTLEIKKAF